MFTKAEDVAALVRIFGKVQGDILEIGCNRGVTTRALAEAFPGRIIHGVDCVRAPMCPGQAGEALRDAGESGAEAVGLPNVRIWRGLSPVVQRRCEMHLAGVRGVFIDGDHRASAVALDTLWAFDFLGRRRAATGEAAVVAWHDYYEGAPGWCGVRETVDSLMAFHGTAVQAEEGTWVAWASARAAPGAGK